MKKLKVLIVDDQPEVYKAIKMFLGLSYETKYCSSGEDAIHVLSEGYFPDLIVSDVVMPGFDGFQFLTRIKQNLHFHNIPVMMISNLDAGRERNRFLNAGASDFIQKPFNAVELKKRIVSALTPV
jgi:DNA-binding response OmpR family regulator